MPKIKTLVLCIDRDNDIGEKTKFNGYFIGEKKCMEVGNALLLADPEDTDANSIFAAVKTKNEIKNSEIAVITGDKDVGIKSDKEVLKQLKAVVRKLKPKETVLVTDGAEDEFVLPIIQSLCPVVSVKRVVVKQSEKLESSYYVIKDFANTIIREPKLARIVIGLPALALIILAIFGTTGWRLILGASGLYLLIKGFQLEVWIERIVNEFMSALRRGRVSFFLYIVSLIFGIIAIFYGYNKMILFGAFEWFISVFAFINGSIPFFFVAVFFFWLGKVVMVQMTSKKETKAVKDAWRLLTILSLAFAITIVAFTSTEFMIKPGVGFTKLIFSICLGFFAIAISLAIERAH